jgi:hypothetical protein
MPAFSQVGNDAKAEQFLSDLDNDPRVGKLILACGLPQTD